MIHLSKAEAAGFMVGFHGLTGFHHSSDQAGLIALLKDLRCIQLDPLSPMGTSPDMVALARIKDYRMGGLFQELMPHHAFEHYAKERCLLPAEAFPYYLGYARERMWPRLSGWFHRNLAKLPPDILTAVRNEVGAHGPVCPSDLSDFGAVVPHDWSGWKGTAKATTLALEILWARCEVVVCGRRGREKIYDLPERGLGAQPTKGGEHFYRWALLERVAAAGLLPCNSGPHWSMLNEVRKTLPTELVEEGKLTEVVVEGMRQHFWAKPETITRPFPQVDDHMRVLGPLDAFLWYRPLIQHLFDFEYVWEVYKPEVQRRWGWYVCPLLHRGQLVGRLQGKVIDDRLVIETVWREEGRSLEREALKACLKRHASALGLQGYRLPRGTKLTRRGSSLVS